MSPAPTRAEFDPSKLDERLQKIERRLDALESRAPETAPASVEPSQDTLQDDRSTATGAADLLPLLGRTLVIVGGAFVLRAVTEAGLLGPAPGSALAVAYAVLWLVMADRSAAKGNAAEAIWHSIAGTIIAYPLLWEATVEFRLLTPGLAAALLGVVTAIGLAVAWRSRLIAIGVVVTLGAVVTLLALAFSTKLLVLFTGWLLVVGLATLWVGYSRGWPLLAWMVAVPVDLTVALVGVIAMQAEPERAAELVPAGPVVMLQLALVVGYVGSFVARTLVARADVRSLEIVQCLASILIGLGGAMALAPAFPVAWIRLGLVAAGLSVAAYAASFTLIDRATRRINFIFYSSLALAFTLVAVTALLPAAILSAVLAIGAVLMAWAGARSARATLSLHGSVYAFGSAAASGLIAGSVSALTLRSLAPGGWITMPGLVSLAGAIAFCAFPVAAHGRTWGRVSALPKFLVLIVALGGLAGVVIFGIARVLPAQDGIVLPTALAILRTAVLAFAAVALAWLGRFPRLVQAGWLVYPVLIAGGVKLLVEDFRVGNPAILVVSLALYGGALIVAPRVLRKTQASPSA